MVNIDFLQEPKDIPIYKKDGEGDETICYVTKTVENNGVWRDPDVLDEKVPIFIMQLIIVTALTHILIFLCRKKLRQPPFVGELLAGILISPSLFGGLLSKNIFRINHLMILETVGNLGLAYHLFLLGLEIDLRTISRKIGSKAVSFGITGAIFPFIFGSVFYAFVVSKTPSLGSMYWGVALSMSGLPAMADTLGRLKLLHSELGRLAMSSGLVNKVISWILLAIVSSITGSHEKFYYALICGLVFLLLAFCVFRPSILWMVKRTRDGEDLSETSICVILTMVLGCGLITDTIGISAVVGPFVLGLVIPQDVLGHRFTMVLQGFVTDFLMPLYYASVGLRLQFDIIIQDGVDVFFLISVVVVSIVPKLMSTIAVSLYFKSPVREGISLAVLMKTKGLFSVVVLTLARDQNILSAQDYGSMIIAILIMTITTSPMMNSLHTKTKHFLPGRTRSLQKLKQDAEMRILTCVHELQTVPGISTILRLSNATRRSPISVFALQLIQLTKHTSALLVVHGPSGSGSQSNRRVNGQTDQMISMFDQLTIENPLLSIRTLSTMSPYATMHEDVWSIAEDKGATFIILPFHKRMTIHNKLEDMNPAYKDVNDNVLANAPCSVGILVDRGIGTPLALEEDSEMHHHVAVIYIGGPDDREALAYAWRMVGHPNVTLTVLRFVPGKDVVDIQPDDFVENGEGFVPLKLDTESERKLDEGHIIEFRRRAAHYNSVVYLEQVSNNGAETVAVIKAASERFDLFIVGRSKGMLSPLKAGLDDWSECPELGTIGDLLVTSDFSASASVLVVQQYCGINTDKDGLASQDRSSQFKQNHNRFKN